MKKLFLLGLAFASTASMVSAQDYVSGGQQVYKEGYNFSVEWANLEIGRASCRERVWLYV